MCINQVSVRFSSHLKDTHRIGQPTSLVGSSLQLLLQRLFAGLTFDVFNEVCNVRCVHFSYLFESLGILVILVADDEKCVAHTTRHGCDQTRIQPIDKLWLCRALVATLSVPQLAVIAVSPAYCHAVLGRAKDSLISGGNASYDMSIVSQSVNQ